MLFIRFLFFWGRQTSANFYSVYLKHVEPGRDFKYRVICESERYNEFVILEKRTSNAHLFRDFHLFLCFHLLAP